MIFVSFDLSNTKKKYNEDHFINSKIQTLNGKISCPILLKLGLARLGTIYHPLAIVLPL